VGLGDQVVNGEGWLGAVGGAGMVGAGSSIVVTGRLFIAGAVNA